MSNGRLSGIVNTKETNRGRTFETECEVSVNKGD